MPNKEAAAASKAQGNAAFQAKDYPTAIKHFTDGTECVKLKPDWAKGYTRKGLAEFFLAKYDDAVDTYKAGLKLAPEDATLKEGLKKASDAKYDVKGARPAGP